MNKILIILLVIILMLAAVGFGGAAGFFYKAQQDAPNLEKGRIAELVKNALSLKIIHSTTAYGNISDINVDEKTLVLSATNGDSIKIKVKDDALIYLMKSDEKGDTVRQQIQFEDIKDGSGVTMLVWFSPDGQMLASSINVISPEIAQKTDMNNPR